MRYRVQNLYRPSFFVLLVVIMLIVLSGCVSQKKYEAAQQEIARLSVDSTFQEYELAEAKFKKDGVIYEQNNELAKKSEKLDSLRAIVAAQQDQLNRQKELLNDLKDADWEVEENQGELVIKLEDDVLFGSGSSDLSEQGVKVVTSISNALLRIDESYEVWVIGHTDNQPYQSDNIDNWQLSANRALSVVRALIDSKVNPSIITATAKSKYDPDFPNNADSGRKLNRRTEIVIVPQEAPYQVLIDLITK